MLVRWQESTLTNYANREYLGISTSPGTSDLARLRRSDEAYGGRVRAWHARGPTDGGAYAERGRPVG